jgi:NADP-reducing hydrogenase subunit HndD
MTSKNITIQINGEQVSTDAANTIMQAVGDMAEIPVICYHDSTTPKGICRQCVVEVDGWRVLAPACVTQISDGMVITTDSDKVLRARKTILEMLNASVDLSQAPDIQKQIELYKVDLNRFPEVSFRVEEIIDDNPFFIRDYSKCLMCWRCVQACGDDQQFTYAITTGGRGYNSKISTFFDEGLPDTTCVFCGNCIGVCPTDALISKTEFMLDQGVDYDTVRIEKRKEQRKLYSKKDGKND